jgi:hypothetical protein
MAISSSARGVELRGSRWLVGVGDTGELRDLTRERLLVEALDIPLGTDFERSVDVYLEEVLPYRAPHLVAHLLERRDGRDDHPDPVAREQLGDETKAQHVYVAVLPREAETLRQIGAYDVPVEDFYSTESLPQFLLDDLANGCLAGPERPVNHSVNPRP